MVKQEMARVKVDIFKNQRTKMDSDGWVNLTQIISTTVGKNLLEEME